MWKFKLGCYCFCDVGLWFNSFRTSAPQFPRIGSRKNFTGCFLKSLLTIIARLEGFPVIWEIGFDRILLLRVGVEWIVIPFPHIGLVYVIYEAFNTSICHPPRHSSSSYFCGLFWSLARAILLCPWIHLDPLFRSGPLFEKKLMVFLCTKIFKFWFQQMGVASTFLYRWGIVCLLILITSPLN